MLMVEFQMILVLDKVVVSYKEVIVVDFYNYVVLNNFVYFKMNQNEFDEVRVLIE